MIKTPEKTASGIILGEHERLSVDDALRAITLGAAYTLKLDHLIGSIESGKYADFAVHSLNLLKVPPEQILDSKILRTVVGGKDYIFD